MGKYRINKLVLGYYNLDSLVNPNQVLNGKMGQRGYKSSQKT
jgi:hypothetical protein